MRHCAWFICSFLAVTVGATTPALAGPRDFVVYAPGMGGTADDARPYLETFFKYLEKKLGWPEKSGSGEYLSEPKAVEDFVAHKQPGFGLLPPAYLFDLQCRKVPVTVIASVQRQNQSSTGRYHLVVKKGGATSLAALANKKVISNHLQDKRYLSKVVFDGKIDVEKHFQLLETASPLKPFKAVDRGQADAALVDDDQLAAMKKQPFGQSLVPIFSSEPMPPAPVVAFDKAVRPSEREALKKALIDMCGSKDGAETCKSMMITRFAPIEARAYQAAFQRYCGK